MRMTEEEYSKLQSKRAHITAKLELAKTVPSIQKKGKYGNRKTVVDGITFDSAKEAARYRGLKEDESAGRIRNLEIQPVFVLAPAVVLRGKKKPALRYYADFSYEAGNGGDWVKIVEDVKSAATKTSALYRAKIHLMKSVHDIDVDEA